MVDIFALVHARHPHAEKKGTYDCKYPDIMHNCMYLLILSIQKKTVTSINEIHNYHIDGDIDIHHIKSHPKLNGLLQGTSHRTKLVAFSATACNLLKQKMPNITFWNLKKWSFPYTLTYWPSWWIIIHQRSKPTTSLVYDLTQGQWSSQNSRIACVAAWVDKAQWRWARSAYISSTVRAPTKATHDVIISLIYVKR